MKFWKKYKSSSRRTQRILFLIAAYLLISIGFMWMPVSAEQTGLPDFTTENILSVSIGGYRPTISTDDPAFTEKERETVWNAIPNIQKGLEEATFYCRTFPLNPLNWLAQRGTCLTIETESGIYQIGTVYNRLFVEVNGAVRYYRCHHERDRWDDQRVFWDEVGELKYYMIEVDNAYQKALGN